MRKDWIKFCLTCSRAEPSFRSSSRKILRGAAVQFKTIKHDLQLTHCGYTRTKMTLLRKQYFHQESIDIAIMLWNKRLKQGSYGSVGFTTYNHFIKSDPNKKSPRGSIMGPCIQAVTLTLLDNGNTGVDVFYRTTEIYKKFPADLVFIRDELLPLFDMKEARLDSITFHFASLTCHPMYFITLIPLLGSFSDVLYELDQVREGDFKLYDQIMRWNSYYLIDDTGIKKFSQALRVHKDAKERIKPNISDSLYDYTKQYMENRKK